MRRINRFGARQLLADMKYKFKNHKDKVLLCKEAIKYFPLQVKNIKEDYMEDLDVSLNAYRRLNNYLFK